tara:strand:+ start:363 stop:512 length:150 start_codon:yes stop_codon:yes gene_type:complete
MSNISNATEKDWSDFWCGEGKSSSEFEKIWWEMESIEPLTPVTRSQRKD